MDLTYHDLTLPSRGKLGYPEVVSIKPYRVREEKYIAAITSERFNEMTLKVLSSVIETEINIEDLSLSDRNYILLWERVNSYYPELESTVKCPNCGRKSTTVINLEGLPVTSIPPNYEEPVTITLPDSGDSIGCRLLRIRDEMNIDKYLSTSKDPEIDDWVVRYAASIVKEDLKSLGEKIMYCDGLSSKDFMEIRSFQNKYFHGVDNKVTFTCKKCGESSNVPIPFNLDFFLPSLSESGINSRNSI
jgi:hypothetical protein